MLQEWNQKPFEGIGEDDEKLQNFMGKWLEFMKPGINEFRRESENPFKPVDITPIVEPNPVITEFPLLLRSQNFNVFVANCNQFREGKNSLISLEDQIEELRKFKGELGNRILDVWDEVD